MEVRKRIRVVIVGGGASGIFAAIQCCEAHPQAEVVVLERGTKLLSKVKVSGGGRCNVTNACFDNRLLVANYPRGERELQGPFSRFAVANVIEWFANNGVNLKTEPDGRMFPVTDSSQTIIDCFLQKIESFGIRIEFNATVKQLIPKPVGFEVKCLGGASFECDALIVACGGNSSREHYAWLQQAGMPVINPVPSLFTFNVPASPFKGLEGIAVETVLLKIAGTKLQQEGPLLITHWGISGPAVLKLSAKAARVLNDMNYAFEVVIDFVPNMNEQALQENLMTVKNEMQAKRVCNTALFKISSRLWERLCELSGIEGQLIWADVSNKKINALSMRLKHFSLKANGKTTFKEEFVTAGGVDLKAVDMKTMESKTSKRLFFCGEVMNVDGVTGGFNFQHAWTSGYIAGRNAGEIRD